MFKGCWKCDHSEGCNVSIQSFEQIFHQTFAVDNHSLQRITMLESVSIFRLILHDWSIHRIDILINLFISVDLLELWAPCPDLFRAVCTKEALSWSPNEALLSEINTVYTVQQLSFYSYFIPYACTRFEYNLLAMVSIIEVNLLKPSLSD